MKLRYVFALLLLTSINAWSADLNTGFEKAKNAWQHQEHGVLAEYQKLIKIWGKDPNKAYTVQILIQYHNYYRDLSARLYKLKANKDHLAKIQELRENLNEYVYGISGIFIIYDDKETGKSLGDLKKDLGLPEQMFWLQYLDNLIAKLKKS